MNGVLKWAIIIVAIIVLVVGGFVAYVAISGIPSYEAQKIDLKVEVTPERVAHGRDLATKLCMMCHMDAGTKRLSGTKMIDLPEEFGVAYSKNITNHPEMGIGKWTDGDIAFLLRTGIHPHTGQYVPPWMPKFPRMADEDLMSVIAWLRSDDPGLEADPKVNTESEPSFLAKFLSHVAFKPFDYPTSSISYPDTTNEVAYGDYLATAVYDCYQCHSADFSTNDPLTPSNSEGFFGGGNAMPDAAGLLINVPNITSSVENGIGGWSKDDFIHTMRYNMHTDGTPMRYPMGRFNNLSDHALGSIYEYLKTVPALETKVERSVASAEWDSKGAELFDTKGCSSCHGANGKGIASLLLADTKYPEDSTMYDVINDQLRYNPDSFMPRYAGTLSDGDLQTLASHVRKLCNDAN